MSKEELEEWLKTNSYIVVDGSYDTRVVDERDVRILVEKINKEKEINEKSKDV